MCCVAGESPSQHHDEYNSNVEVDEFDYLFKEFNWNPTYSTPTIAQNESSPLHQHGHCTEQSLDVSTGCTVIL